MPTAQQSAAINNLLETKEGREKLTASLVPSLKRRGKIDIAELRNAHELKLRPGNWERLERVLRDACERAGITPAARRRIPTAEWVEAWIAL